MCRPRIAYAGTDHVHPDRAGYARLAAETRGGSPAQAAPYRDFMSPARVYRAFPEMKVWNGSGSLNGAPAAGVVRP
jgi:hypothetical protein